ncbi:glutaredoxin family protein [Lysobacter sp. BMK333-48F3]|uniref:glutaredoxin family protein n=1 Tax=Lysobacter sp. BMK333-48F3 TaxID=2867962 RepID=UPI001C8BAFAF|nr:glutaredoxin family protein [Lysobacter sp. BMK333-48F3]MBX9403737.1 glutaredoxin family protein [Lysobacter sp. BMK333-48F3]
MSFKSILGTIAIVVVALALGVGAGTLVKRTGLIGDGGKGGGAMVEQGDYSQVYAQAGGEVVLYSLSTCPFCHKAKELLQKQNIRFVERVIDKDEAARKEADGLKIKSVPVIYVGNQSLHGYDEAKLAEILAAHAKGAKPAA